MQSRISPSALSSAIRVAMALVVAAAAVAWLAVGDTVDGSAGNQRAAAAALAEGVDVAEATNSMADQMQNWVNALVVGAGSASEAMSHTIEVSENVGLLLDIVKDLEDKTDKETGKKLVAIQTGLAEAQASLLETQGGVDETQQSLTATQPAIQTAVAALEKVPDQLRAAQTDLANSVDAFDNQLGLWRTAVILIAVALLLAFFVVDRVVGRLVRQP